MAETSIRKVSAASSPRGAQGQKCLAAGSRLGMRLWENEQPGALKPVTRRDYETVGYVLAGRAELHIAPSAPESSSERPGDLSHGFIGPTLKNSVRSSLSFMKSWAKLRAAPSLEGRRKQAGILLE